MALLPAIGSRSLVLVGMMGAGKTSVGKRLALALGLPFADADSEIELAAGMSVEEIFAQHGETAFRDGEVKVIRRLLQNGPQVMATGGGAFISPVVREEVRRHGISIWLSAPMDILMLRVARRDNRPLLKTANPRAVMEKLLSERSPFYAEADMTVESRDTAHETVVDELIARLGEFLDNKPAANGAAKAIS
jgi:shikimate kinase